LNPKLNSYITFVRKGRKMTQPSAFLNHISIFSAFAGKRLSMAALGD
jgi:hypothetical protein